VRRPLHPLVKDAAGLLPAQKIYFALVHFILYVVG
jgi:hypothetical protein